MTKLASPFSGIAPAYARVVRTIVFATWAFSAYRMPLQRLHEIPLADVEPTGILALLPSTALGYLFGNESALAALTVLTAGLALWSATGWGFRFASPIATLAFLTMLSVHRSYSFVNHGEIGNLLAGAIFSAMAWADHFEARRCRRAGLPAPSPRHDLAFMTVITSLLLAYAGIGIHRLSDDSPDVFLSNPVPVWAFANSFKPSFVSDLIGPIARAISHNGFASWILAVGFPMITIFEVLSPWTLFSRPFRLLWLFVMSGFHFLSLLVLNLFFWENLLLIWLILPWIDVGRAAIAKPDASATRRKRDRRGPLRSSLSQTEDLRELDLRKQRLWRYAGRHQAYATRSPINHLVK
jgi:hypothetical protein